MARAAGPLPYLSKVTLYSSSAAGYLGSTSLTSPDLSVEEVGEGQASPTGRWRAIDACTTHSELSLADEACHGFLAAVIRAMCILCETGGQ